MIALTPEYVLQSVAPSLQLITPDQPLVELGSPISAKIIPSGADLSAAAPFTLGLGVISVVPLPVSVRVKWEVLKPDGHGNFLTLSTEEFKSDVLTTSDDPNDPAIPNQASQASFLFAPAAFIELTNNMPLPVPEERRIRATVTVSVTYPTVINGVTSAVAAASATLPDLIFFVPVLPIPTVVALFRHDDFAPITMGPIPKKDTKLGAAVVLVPANSPLRSINQVLGVLRALIGTVAGLVQLPAVAGILLGMRTLADAIPAQPFLAFIAADSIDDMSKIPLIDVETPYTVPGSEVEIKGGGNITVGGASVKIPATDISIGTVAIPGTDSGSHNVKAMDQMSSLILIGPPPKVDPLGPIKRSHVIPHTPGVLVGRAIRCFNDFRCDADLGEFTVTLRSEMYATVPSFNRDLRDSNSSNPSGRVSVQKLSSQNAAGGFDNVLSSVQFAWEPI